MCETPTTTLQIWPTAKGDQWRVTCPWHHRPPLLVRGASTGYVYDWMSEHVKAAHGWKVTGVQILGVPAPKKEQK